MTTLHHKFDNSGEMEKCIEKYNLTKLTQKIENLNSSISINEITCIIKNLSHRKTPGP